MPRSLGGLVAVVGAGVLWGLGGTAAQILFDRYAVEPLYLVVVRLWGAGLLLTLFLALTRPRSLRLAPGDLGRLAAFGVLGFFIVQFSYFAAIARIGVAMTTFLQYLGPPMIAAWVTLRDRRPPSAREAAALALAVAGTLLLVLGAGGLRLEGLGVALGILSAVSLAFYTLYAQGLLVRLGPLVMTAYGFLFGALAGTLAWPLWQGGQGALGPESLALTAFVVVCGTLLPFALYVFGLTRLSPTAAGIGATAEPLAAALSALVVLGQSLRGPQYVGGALIVLAMAALAGARGRRAGRRRESRSA